MPDDSNSVFKSEVDQNSSPSESLSVDTDSTHEASQKERKSLLTKPIAAAKSVADSVVDAGKTVTSRTAKVGQAIAHKASETGQSALKAVTELGGTAAKRSQHLVEQAATGTGYAVDFVEDSPLIRKLTGILKLDWLVGVSDQVDLQKAETAVRTLQQKYPDESSSQIAHRIMLDKAIYAGGIGLATSMVPGEAIALLAVNLATTTALQTEMLYQIAAAYNLDLKDPARKGEVLAIFGLALGGTRAIQAGLVFFKNLPLAGMLIGASANATMLYALGYAACRYYEAKLNPDVVETSAETLEEIHQKSETYLDVALAQQAIMDQVLTRMILASYPEKRWEDILPSLQSLGLHPASLKTISEHLKTPQPLVALLEQLNHDFAVQTYAYCYAIAQLDGSISPEEEKVLSAIRHQFPMDTDQIQESIQNQPMPPLD